MIYFKTVIVAIVGAVTLLLLIRNIDKWARSLQRFYTLETKKFFGNSLGWEKPWRLYLLKFMVFFVGLMFVIIFYDLVFNF
jgi:uncharacterized membrane protein YeaQ/YmgE (transglycosylase-associated protein family)